MVMKQINLKLPSNLHKAAKKYADNFGFRNIQDLAAESLREKIFDKNEYDETFSKEEVELIDELISTSIKKRKIFSEADLNKVLLR